jgi:hypothetical protein
MNKLYVLFLCLSHYASAQKHDYIWTFGHGKTYPNFGGTNINFNVNPPDTDYVKRDINFNTNCASICDELGKLLFCTNGCKIFSGKNKLVKNGTGLNPGYVSTEYCDYGNIMPQGSLFLPHPADTSLYYLFHLRPEYVEKDFLGGIGDKIYYTLLDKRGDNGNGEVLSKNNVIHEDTFSFGKMRAVRHGNGRDWWIIVPRMLKNQYIKLLLTNEGIKGPFFQNIGLKNLDDDGTGQAVFSPDGTKYIHFDRYNDLNIFDFDRCTGELSNLKKILLPTARDSVVFKNDIYPYYTVGGVAVSSNSKYLYVTALLDIFQYNLKANNIVESVRIVAKNDSFKFNGLWTTFYLPHIAPDNKIYINCTNGVRVLHVINNPDEEGLACNVTQHSFKLPTYNSFSIPNFPNFRLGKIDKAICETPIATKEVQHDVGFKIFPNPVTDILNIQYTNNQSDINLDIVITNLSGSLVLKSVLDANDSKIDISSFQNGFYFLSFFDNNRLIATERFVKTD